MIHDPDQAEPGAGLADNTEIAAPEEEDRPSAAELEEAGQSALFGGDAGAGDAPAEAKSADETKAAGESESGAQTAAPSAADEAAASNNPMSDSKAVSDEPYRVLARKYRPQTFSQLIGQEPMVQTLANAIKRDRLAHAFLMTGVRGVGKTSTARLIAKSLNCIGPDGKGGPTIDPCGECEPCQAIAEGRHIDVIEMDAASHTGVDDVREIIEAVRYAAVSARYKIYIIDEVHMLSRNAFNALLKTLEEPPAHVKFLFATTEVDKLPVTVLSRTQRFDLRRIPTERLQAHFANICEQEGVAADGEALSLIAAAAEGSVRDGLSILDQAIAHADLDGDGRVSAERVRDMLGLADKGAQRRILAAVLDGDGPALLAGVDEQYALGVEPLALMRALMGLVHQLALVQVSGEIGGETPEDEAKQLKGWAERLSAPQTHRLWQLMLKGYDEVRSAPDPLVASQMALLRALYAADMPDPGSLVKKLDQLAHSPPAGGSGADAASAPAGAGASPPSADILGYWARLVEQVEAAGKMHAASIMRMQVQPIALEPGRLIYARAPHFTQDIRAELRDALSAATGENWRAEEEPGRLDEAQVTLVERQEAEKLAAQQAIREQPLVKAALAAFPDAEFVDESANPPRQPRRRFG